jgi:[protein-PII] uridylyltransferase
VLVGAIEHLVETAFASNQNEVARLKDQYRMPLHRALLTDKGILPNLSRKRFNNTMTFDIDRYFPDDNQEFGDAGRASFEEKRPLYLSAGKHFLNHYGEQVKTAHRAGATGAWVVKANAEMVDILIKKLFSCISADLGRAGRARPHYLVAMGIWKGGLILFRYQDVSQRRDGRCRGITAGSLFSLGYRLDVGYSIRTIDDCIEMANSDSTVKTALLDTRMLAGSRNLFNDLRKTTLTQIMAKGSDAFIRQKIVELEQRREKYGSSVYLLEPNIKEGEGGLRDLHTAMWVAKVKYKIFEPRELILKGVLLEEDLANYNDQLSALWRIRNELHYLAGRRNDQLTFEDQNNLAAFLVI